MPIAGGALLQDYAPPAGVRDEAVARDGTPRTAYRGALDALAGRDLPSLAASLRARMRRDGVTYSSVQGPEEFVVDPVPRAIDGQEWDRLAAGLVQRVRALEAFVADAYGPRSMVADGIVPARVLDGADHREDALRGFRPPGPWIGVAGLDVVRGADGVLRVLEDNLRTPSGIGYALAVREALVAELGPIDGAAPRSLDGAAAALGAVLRDAAPAGGDGHPHVVVLSDGAANSAWYEHRRLAAAMAAVVVAPGDLAVEGDRLVLRASGRPVDAVYRRTDDDRLDTPIGRLLRGPWLAGTLGLVNAFGTGVADDKLTHAYVEDVVRHVTGAEPLLPSVRTFDLADPSHLEEVLDGFGEMVVKPRTGHGGIGVVICAHADAATVERTRRAVRDDPGSFVAQPLVMLSTHPTVVDGRLAPRHVDLRPFVLQTRDALRVLPGGLTRVAFGEGALVVNSAQNGGAKDTWVLR